MREEGVERGSIQVLSLNDHGANFLSVVDIVERVRVEQHEVGGLPVCNSAEIIGATKEFRGVKRHRLQRFKWSEPRVNQRGEFIVQIETRNHKGRAARV